MIKLWIHFQEITATLFQYYHTWNYILKCVRVFWYLKIYIIYNLRTMSTLCYFSHEMSFEIRVLAFVIIVWMSRQMWMQSWWKSHIFTNCHEFFFVNDHQFEVILICKNWWCNEECCYLICINVATAITLTFKLHFTKCVTLNVI